MTHTHNSQRTVLRVWLVFFLIEFLAVAAQFLFDIDRGGGALLMPGLFLGVMSPIVVLVYRSRIRLVREMVSGKQFLAHWTYGEKE